MNSNGHDPQGMPAAATPPSPQQLAQVQASLAQLDAPIRSMLQIMLRGLMVSAPNVAPHVILSMACWQMGNITADAIQGDIATMVNLRRAFKSAFDDGVSKAKLVVPMAMPPGGPLPGQ